ncbi:MAG: universal stress protein [Microthrixaceae bacterium]
MTAHGGDVVVGVDPAAIGMAPLFQAMEEANLRGCRLRVVSVWSYPPLSTEERLLTTASALEAEAIDRVGAAVAQLRDGDDSRRSTVEVDVVEGPPAKVLISEASGGALLVVGRRDRSRLRHLLLGSVADQCVRHCPEPVMVVPSEWDPSQHQSGDIVVGMDFSEMSRAALEWALEEARLRGVSVRVVHCWEEPMIFGGDLMMELPDAALLERSARERLDGLVASLDPPDGVTVSAETVRGRPGPALTEAAEGAALTVIGTRGLGGFSGLLLGSVARRVTHLAAGPVVVIRSSTKE